MYLCVHIYTHKPICLQIRHMRTSWTKTYSCAYPCAHEYVHTCKLRVLVCMCVYIYTLPLIMHTMRQDAPFVNPKTMWVWKTHTYVDTSVWQNAGICLNISVCLTSGTMHLLWNNRCCLCAKCAHICHYFWIYVGLRVQTYTHVYINTHVSYIYTCIKHKNTNISSYVPTHSYIHTRTHTNR